MFKIPFSGNPEVTDLVQVRGLERLEDFPKHIPKRIMSATLLKESSLHPQVKPNKRCIVFYKRMGKRKNLLDGLAWGEERILSTKWQT